MAVTAIAMSCVIVACGTDSGSDDVVDTPDAANDGQVTPDATTKDASVMDATVIDASVADGASHDATTQDAKANDASLADAADAGSDASADAGTDASDDSGDAGVMATCGDDMAQGAEVCDGVDLKGATCASLGHAPGTLACAPTCDAFDTTLCTGGYVPANTGFAGKVCFDGVRYAPPAFTLPYVMACTEDMGVQKTNLDAPATWASVNGVTLTNLHGRVVVTQPDGPPDIYLSDNSTANNAFRSNNQGASWTPLAYSNAGNMIEVFAALPGSSVNNAFGGWDSTLGAVVLHGTFTTPTVSFVGAAANSVTGTVRGLAKGATTDVWAAVNGKTPAGVDGVGGGLYWSCDISGAAGGTFTERDTGIDVNDKPLVSSLTVDPSSFNGGAHACGAGMVAGYATTYYAALRGGGQVYKTVDGGGSWQQSNTGLPAGAEVYVIAIDCFSTATPQRCVNNMLLFAATSMGLYKSVDGGATWKLDGLEGKAVRGVTVEPEHAVATLPRVFAAVDDATAIYSSAP